MGAENPYESPHETADRARYDRSLMWRITKFCLGFMGFLVGLNTLLWLQHTLLPSSQGAQGVTSFFLGERWTQDVQEILQRFW
jgi:hypothetical protein